MPLTNTPTPHLIVGLGNPGHQYAHTYHNAGILFVDFLAASLTENDVRWHTPKKEAFTYTKVGPFTLVRACTFMNASGRTVARALRYFDISPQELLIAHDDTDLALGTYKVQRGRGDAGHHGVASVIAHLHTNAFWRLRIGIRSQQGKAGKFVLKKMDARDYTTLAATFTEVCRLLGALRAESE